MGHHFGNQQYVQSGLSGISKNNVISGSNRILHTDISLSKCCWVVCDSVPGSVPVLSREISPLGL